jgi:uncharacterized protein YdhG (YjbR/CyaY superfamily)
MGIARRRRDPKTIDEYIDRCAPQAQTILRRVRATIVKAAPDATETISYGIPAFKLRRILVYFAGCVQAPHRTVPAREGRCGA